MTSQKTIHQISTSAMLNALKHNIHDEIYYEQARVHDKVMRDHYRIGELLGRGAYGEVRKCVYKEDRLDKNDPVKQYRAVKIMGKAHMEEKDVENFKQEVACLMIL